MTILHITIATPLGGIRKKMHTCRFCVFEANTLTLQKHTCYPVIANTYTVGFSTVNGNLLLTLSLPHVNILTFDFEDNFLLYPFLERAHNYFICELSFLQIECCRPRSADFTGSVARKSHGWKVSNFFVGCFQKLIFI